MKESKKKITAGDLTLQHKYYYYDFNSLNITEGRITSLNTSQLDDDRINVQGRVISLNATCFDSGKYTFNKEDALLYAKKQIQKMLEDKVRQIVVLEKETEKLAKQLKDIKSLEKEHEKV